MITNRLRKLSPRDLIPPGGPGSVGIAYLDDDGVIVIRLDRHEGDVFVATTDASTAAAIASIPDTDQTDGETIWNDNGVLKVSSEP